MQDFHADCTIKLFVASSGKPEKMSWACILEMRNGHKIISAQGFMGVVSREVAYAEALEFGLDQAKRLRQEKIGLATKYPILKNLDSRQSVFNRDPELRLKRDNIDALWESFRLKKSSILTPEDDEALLRLAGRVFKFKGKGVQRE